MRVSRKIILFINLVGNRLDLACCLSSDQNQLTRLLKLVLILKDKVILKISSWSKSQTMLMDFNQKVNQ